MADPVTTLLRIRWFSEERNLHRSCFCIMRMSICNRLLGVLLLVLCLSAGRAEFSRNDQAESLAQTPPRGWNSYNAFSWIISEEEFLQNANFVAANLSKHGYEYVVVDFLWYRRFEPDVTVWSAGHEVIDEYGRLVPDPERWPSTRGGKGFKPLADKLHAMGLKFGIHVMRGISTQAVVDNTKICNAMGSPDGVEGCYWTAKDIAILGTECNWMKDCFMSVNTTNEGGLVFLDSLYQQYADWGVDFIKHDCVFGVDDLSVSEITAVSEAITKAGRPLVYSISPGVRATPGMAKQVAHLTHMYRVTSDDWDMWWDVLLHFSVARDFAAAGLIGAPGLQGGRSWPDLDMLPLGWLTDPGAPHGPYRSCSLSKAEQRTQVTLWSIAKSPLMFGGDLRHIDRWTFDLITNPTVLEINAHSTHNHEFRSSPSGFLPEVKLRGSYMDCVSVTSIQWKLRRGKDGLMEVCWSRSPRRRYSKGRHHGLLTGCLNWSEIPWTPKEQSNRSKRGLVWSEAGHQRICLEADNTLRHGTEESASFGLCNHGVSQVWHLTPEGSLVSEGAQLCAGVVQPQQGWRIWVARGTSGQGYVAFFNLGEKALTIAAPLNEVLGSLELLSSKEQASHQIAKAIDLLCQRILKHVSEAFHFIMSKFSPHRYAGTRPRLRTLEWTCSGENVWEGKPVPQHSLTSSLVASVEPHGTTVVELKCSENPQHSQTSTDLLSALGFTSIIVAVCLLGGRKALNKFRCKRAEVSPLEKPLQVDKSDR